MFFGFSILHAVAFYSVFTTTTTNYVLLKLCCRVSPARLTHNARFKKINKQFKADRPGCSPSVVKRSFKKYYNYYTTQDNYERRKKKKIKISAANPDSSTKYMYYTLCISLYMIKKKKGKKN